MIHSSSKMAKLLVKAVLGLAIAGCALPASQYAQVAALRASLANDAVRIAPLEARVLASKLGRRFEENSAFQPSAGDLDDMRTALSAQPLETKLLSVLGLSYEAAGDTKQAYRMMQLAARTSRHDVVSGLYMIEAASASGDVRNTLRHYNAVLSTQPELYPTLFPILASAVSYPEIRPALRPYLEIGARWVPPFVAAAAESANAKDLEALLLPLPAELLREEYAPALGRLLYRLALQGEKSAVARFARAIIPELPSSELTNLGVSTKMLDKRLGSFAWTFPSVAGIRVEPGANNSMQISAEPLSRGIVASRDLVVDGPETYQFMQRLDYGSGVGKITARWIAECITPTGSQRFWEQRLPQNGQEGTYRSVVNVPENCKIMRISLEAEAADSQLPSSLNIEDLTLIHFR